MAKLRGAKKAAFLRRMARGRRKAGIKNPTRRRRRRNPTMTRITAANPARKRRKHARRRPGVARARTRRRRTSVVTRVASLPMSLVRSIIGGARTMAKKRKRKSNPRRRRRNPGALLVNPRRRRRRARNPHRRQHHRRRRHRNPGLGNMLRGGLSSVALAAIPATLGAFAFSFLDAKFLGKTGTMVRNVAKLIFAGLLGTVGRNWLGRDGSNVAMGAVLGTIGAEFGVRAAGGLVAMNPAESLKELVLQAANDGEMQAQLGALIDGGIGGTAAADFDNAMQGEIPLDYANALTGQGFQGEGMF
jgi:hypothetical protein